VIALVTGANGFLGRALVKRLLADGAADEVRCLVRTESTGASLQEHVGGAGLAPASLLVGSLDDAAFLDRALDDVGVLFHLAASARGAPADIFHSTVVGSQRLLDAMRRLDVLPRTVLVSSLGVYGTAQQPRDTVIDEATPVEPQPPRRDPYSYAKIRQEELFVQFAREQGLGLTVVRPGVLLGPGGNPLPGRLGIRVPGLFLLLGGGTRLPFTFVDNCAEALRLAGSLSQTSGQTYNVVDDELPTCREYLRLFERHVRHVRSITVPYFLTLAMSHAIQWYHGYSRGQLPAFLTPYRVAALWKGWRFSNDRLKGLGWRPRVPMADALRLTFEAERLGLRAG